MSREHERGAVQKDYLVIGMHPEKSGQSHKQSKGWPYG